MASKRQDGKKAGSPVSPPKPREIPVRSIEDLRELWEAIPEALIGLDEQGAIKLANAHALALVGYTRKELKGRKLVALLPTRQRAALSARWKEYVVAPYYCQIGCEMEQSVLRKNGTELPVEISLAPLNLPGGKLMLCAMRDLTESRQIENAMREARRFAESTLEAIPASVAVLDERGIVISTNQAWVEFANANAALLQGVGTGANYLAICETAAGGGREDGIRFAAGIRAVLRGDLKRFSMEYPCHSPDQQLWFIGYATAFKGDGPAKVVIAHVDVSERKRAEMVIRKLNTELEVRVEGRTAELTAANQQLLQEIARRRQLEREVLEISVHEQERVGQGLHEDLGQQLAGILCLGGVLEVSLSAQKREETKDAAKIIGLVRDALELTRTLARCLHPVAVEAGGLVAALQALSKRTTQVYGVRCDCSCPPELDLDMKTATQLYRITQEAVANAIQHGKAHHIEIQLSSNHHKTLLSVKDHGNGISVPHPETRGRGLRIMKYRAEIMGGTLDVLGEDSGGGTTVICKIPQLAQLNG